MVTKGSERQQALRKRKKAIGLKNKEIWCFPEDWPEIKEFIKWKTEQRLNSIQQKKS